MPPPRIAAIVMAGGEGSRLRPLTEDLPKPALPFAQHCRIIDFVLANLHHSAVVPVWVLLQYKPLSLLQHLRTHWPDARPLLPTRGFRGTADAVAQCLHRVEMGRTDIVAVLAADHVYRMDLQQMADFHLRHGAGVTVAAVAVPRAEAHDFGVLCVDRAARITAFEEKPACATPLPDDPARALVSMGNYMFSPQVLAAVLGHGAPPHDALDFGRDVIPELVRRGLAYAYDFRRNVVPGLQPGEEPAYWRDVGTLAAYHQAQRDAAGPQPRFVLENPCWPVAATLARQAVAAPEPACAMP